MAEREARVRLRVTGRSDVKRALNGVTQDARRAEVVQRRERAMTARDGARSSADILRSTRRGVAEGLRSFSRAERDKRREMRETTREAQRNARAQAREDRRTRDARRAGGGSGGYGTTGSVPRGGRLGAVVGAGAAGVAGGVGYAHMRATGYGGALGFRSTDQLIQANRDLQLGLLRLGGQGGLDDTQRGALQSRIFDVARSTAADPLELLGVLETGQNRFSNLDFFAASLETISAAAVATGSDARDVAGALGEFQRQMGVTADQVPALIGIIAQSAREGSVEMADIAASLSQEIGRFQRTTGASGLGGAREFLSVAQALGTAGVGGAGVATFFANVANKLNNADVRTALKKDFKLDPAQFLGRTGGFTDFIQALAADPSADMVKLQGAFGRDQEALQALSILLDVERNAARSGRGSELDRLYASSSTEGNAMISSVMQGVNGTSFGQAAADAATQLENFAENGDEFTRTLAKYNAAFTDVTSRYPGWIFAAESLASAMTAAGVAAIAFGPRLGGILELARAALGLAAGTGGAIGLGLTGVAGVTALAYEEYQRVEQGERTRRASAEAARRLEEEALRSGDRDALAAATRQRRSADTPGTAPGYAVPVGDVGGRIFGGGGGGDIPTVRLDEASLAELRALRGGISFPEPPAPAGGRRGPRR